MRDHTWRTATMAVFVCCLVGAFGQSHATSCAPPPTAAEALAEADAVFVGEIRGAGRAFHPLWCVEDVFRQIVRRAHGDEICMGGYIDFAVLEHFKGELGPQVTLDTDWPVELREPFSVGAKLLIYAPLDSDGRLRFWECGRVLFLSSAEDDLARLRASRANAQ
jgi:hypothetical protein